jgi:hypothetical protein
LKGNFMAPFAMPLITTIAGAAITGMMNRGGGMASMPTVKAPSVGDQDKTPGVISDPSLGSAASSKQLSNSQTVSNKLLGG